MSDAAQSVIEHDGADLLALTEALCAVPSVFPDEAPLADGDGGAAVAGGGATEADGPMVAGGVGDDATGVPAGGGVAVPPQAATRRRARPARPSRRDIAAKGTGCGARGRSGA